MIDLSIKSAELSKGITEKYNMEVLASIIDDTGKRVVYTLKDDFGNIIDKEEEYTATPIEINRLYFYNDFNYFPQTEYFLLLNVENEDHISVFTNFIVKTYQIKDLERTNKSKFRWKVKNYCINQIWTKFELLDNHGNIIDDSNTFVKLLGPLYSTFEYESLEIPLLPDGRYYYRIHYGCNEEHWDNYYPNESGIEIELRDNKPPKARIKDPVIRKEYNGFLLSGKIFYLDEEMDDIDFTISDNFNNTIYKRNRFDYSPKIQRFSHLYPLLNFNNSYLRLSTTVWDRFLDKVTVYKDIKLWHIYDLYRERDTFKWKYRNFSNKMISMQIETLDFYGNPIKIGNVMSFADSFNYIDVEEPNEMRFERDYYVYRLKVWCNEEGWVEYYPFIDGIQFTVRPHYPPKIHLHNCEIIRDLDDIRYLVLQADITDNEDDPIMFTVKDDSNQILRQSSDFIDTPYYLNMKTEYRIINRSHVKITLHVEDTYNGVAEEEILLTAYKIIDLRQQLGHIFQWTIENYSIMPLHTSIEILSDASNIEDREIITTTSEYIFENSHRPKTVIHRLMPKLNVGFYWYRLKIVSPYEDNFTHYYPNEEGIRFYVGANNPPEAVINIIDLTREGDHFFSIKVNALFRDKDLDLIKYSIKDQLGNYYINQKELIESPKTVNCSFLYNTDNLDIPRLFLEFTVVDELDYTTTIIEKIGLYDVKTLEMNIDKQMVSWLFKNYSNIPITMQVEVLDKYGYLYGRSEEVTCASQISFRELFTYMDLWNYDIGKYSYRLKLWHEGEDWEDYYPSMNGIPFEIIDNDGPKIKFLSDPTIIKDNRYDRYEVNLNATITDRDNDKVKYSIKDNR